MYTSTSSRMKNFSRKVTTFFASPRFFYGVLVFFILEALWFTFTALYPMAFDEDFHLGIIRIYAGQWSPFLAGQPEGAHVFGAVARDPSYLFHYLMSFPYRVVSLFTHQEAIQVVSLRLINVGLFVWSLALFRRVLQRAGSSPALSHVLLALFVLIPIVPQLAGQINYDNLLMVCIAWVCLLAFRLVASFRQQRVDTTALITLLIVCVCTSLIKYAALPLLVAVVLFVAVMAGLLFRHTAKRFRMRLKDGYLRMSKLTKVSLCVALVVGSLLFVQRYGVNLVTYHDPVPDCGTVLTTEQCLQYGPWGRDYLLEQQRPTTFQANPLTFMKAWIGGMQHRLFFAVSGPKTLYATYAELPIPRLTFSVLAIASLAAVILWWRQVFQGRAFLVCFLLMIVLYCTVLWLDQFGMYRRAGETVALNGRYLLPVLLPAGAIAGRALAIGLARYKAATLKPYVAAAAILLFLHGGGVFTFILRSDDSWYWQTVFARKLNHGARDVLRPLIKEGYKYVP